MISLKVKNPQAAKKISTKLYAKLEKFQSPAWWKVVAAEFHIMMTRIFQSSGKYGDHKQWAILSKYTAAAKYRKQKGGDRTADILHPAGAAGFEGTFRPLLQTKNQMLFGSDVMVKGYSLSKIHQLGMSPAGRKKALPKREHVYIAPETRARIKKIVKDFIR